MRQMELVNKFDNALSGVAGDNGAIGVAVNAANFLETGSFWDMRHCEPADGETHDRNQVAAPDISAGQQDALFGAIAAARAAQHRAAALPAAGPLQQPRPDHARRAHDQGAGQAAHDLRPRPHEREGPRPRRSTPIDQLGYHGVVSTHSWATPDAYPRIYQEGGFITPYAGDSTGFVDKWRRHVGWADPRYYFGIGYGADMNGLGAQGDPRGAGVTNPVTYPFKGIDGVTVHKQTAGQRTWDINADGVAQYGLYPDWIAGPRQGRRRRRAAGHHRRHGPRRRGLPADVGARRGHRARLLPQPRAAQAGLRGAAAGPPRHDAPEP